MFEFLKQIFGINPAPTPKADTKRTAGSAGKITSSEEPLGYEYSARQKEQVITEYFQLHEKIEAAQKAHDYRTAIVHARRTYRLLPAFVKAWTREYGRFDINGSVAVHTGSTLMAVMSDREGIEELRRTLSEIPELQMWMGVAEVAEKDVATVDAILDLLSRKPGVLQSDLKGHLDTEDGRRPATLSQWLEKAGRIRRERHGQAYRLFLQSPSDTVSLVKSTSSLSQPRRPNRPAKKTQLVDVTSLPYIPLPQAPTAWAERAEREHTSSIDGANRKPTSRFAVVGDSGWEIAAEEKLPPKERPDTAFQEIHPTNGGAFLVAPNGRAEGHEGNPAAVQVRDRSGKATAERGLLHDVYRTGVNPLGHGIAFMSKDCIVHGYDENLKTILDLSLRNIPEIHACAERLGINADELKNHVRCVALSASNSRHLFTVVDEAWCFSTPGEVLWGVRMPVKEGWTQVAHRSGRIGTSAEIKQAIGLMGLDYPITPEDVKRRHRELAKRWHPDLNPGDVSAQEKMQRLNAAVEILTGVDSTSLSGISQEVIYYEKNLNRTRVEVPGGSGIDISIGFVMSEKHAADWIYAANFAASHDNVFVASYSGRIVEISPDGNPLRAYDIGAVPRRIVDTGDYLYILTDTRLYVLAGEKLHTVIDVLDQGDLVVAQTGFGPLERKMFRWFREDGIPLGTVEANDPIRRVYSTPKGMVVETRQHRAEIVGAPFWWEKKPSS